MWYGVSKDEMVDGDSSSAGLLNNQKTTVILKIPYDYTGFYLSSAGVNLFGHAGFLLNNHLLPALLPRPKLIPRQRNISVR